MPQTMVLATQIYAKDISHVTIGNGPFLYRSKRDIRLFESMVRPLIVDRYTMFTH